MLGGHDCLTACNHWHITAHVTLSHGLPLFHSGREYRPFVLESENLSRAFQFEYGGSIDSRHCLSFFMLFSTFQNRIFSILHPDLKKLEIWLTGKTKWRFWPLILPVENKKFRQPEGYEMKNTQSERKKTPREKVEIAPSVGRRKAKWTKCDIMRYKTITISDISSENTKDNYFSSP